MKTRTLLWFNLSALLVGLGLILHGAPPLPVLLGIAAAGFLSYFRRNRAKPVSPLSPLGKTLPGV